MNENNKCSTCKYRARVENITICQYILIKHEPRECEPGNVCIKYEKGAALKEKLPPIVRRTI